VLGFAGWSGSGKTTLLCGVLPYLRAAGLRVSTIKHAHHGLDLDKPGKDSFRHREAGACEVLAVGGMRWALMRETPEGPPDLTELVGRLAPVDLILVEGFKSYDFPRLEVFRPGIGKPSLWPEIPGIVAVATDAGPDLDMLLGCPCPVLDLNDLAAIARWIVAFRASLKAGA
jgi:molybdopterin-guanine dinucleotide biosynthesis protein B